MTFSGISSKIFYCFFAMGLKGLQILSMRTWLGVHYRLNEWLLLLFCMLLLKDLGFVLFHLALFFVFFFMLLLTCNFVMSCIDCWGQVTEWSNRKPVIDWVADPTPIGRLWSAAVLTNRGGALLLGLWQICDWTVVTWHWCLAALEYIILLPSFLGESLKVE